VTGKGLSASAAPRYVARAKGSLRESAVTRITLHEELVAILRERGGGWMTTRELADAVNERGRYHKRDGSPVDDFQVHGRTKNYPQLFDRDGSRVRLRIPPGERGGPT
jgi:hypothetical protein